MSSTSRILSILRSRKSRGLDTAEDPRELLDESYDQLVGLLHQVRQALAEVAIAKKRIELQGQELGARHTELGRQAEDALDQGREDLARTTLERRIFLERQIVTLRDQFIALQRQASGMQEKERHLAERVAAFRVEKETIKASFTASQAQVRVNEALGGVGSPMNDIGNDLDRARDRVAQMRARAAATDELLSSGALSGLEATPNTDVERQLAALVTNAEVDRRVHVMRQTLRSAPRVGAQRRGTEPGTWLSIGDDHAHS